MQIGVREMDEELKIVLSREENINNLKEIRKRITRSLYVYEKSQDPDSNYDYKAYVNSILLYTISSDNLMEGNLVSIIVNLNTILNNNFGKQDFRKIILECRNYINYLLKESEIYGENNR